MQDQKTQDLKTQDQMSGVKMQNLKMQDEMFVITVIHAAAVRALCCGWQHGETAPGIFAVVVLVAAILQASVVLLLLFLPWTLLTVSNLKGSPHS